jgi:TorA maturation chaperone TorD
MTKYSPEQFGALALIYDTLSVGFAYPDKKLYGVLDDGGFIAGIKEATSLLPEYPGLGAAAEKLAAGVSETLATHDLLQLETEYIALFDVNLSETPLHPDSQLYDPKKTDRAAQLHELQRIYRDGGMALKTGEGAEQPDHITVELEFMAYLHEQRRLAETNVQDDAASKWEQAIQRFHPRLGWIPRFVEQLEGRTDHPFYVSLGILLVQLLAGMPVISEKI